MTWLPFSPSADGTRRWGEAKFRGQNQRNFFQGRALKALLPGQSLPPCQGFRRRRGSAGKRSNSRGEKRDPNFSFFSPVISSLPRGAHTGDWERCDGKWHSIEKLGAAQIPQPDEAKPCSVLGEFQLSSSPRFHPIPGSRISSRDQRAAIPPVISSGDGAQDTGNAKGFINSAFELFFLPKHGDKKLQMIRNSAKGLHNQALRQRSWKCNSVGWESLLTRTTPENVVEWPVSSPGRGSTGIFLEKNPGHRSWPCGTSRNQLVAPLSRNCIRSGMGRKEVFNPWDVSVWEVDEAPGVLQNFLESLGGLNPAWPLGHHGELRVCDKAGFRFSQNVLPHSQRSESLPHGESRLQKTLKVSLGSGCFSRKNQSPVRIFPGNSWLRASLSTIFWAGSPKKDAWKTSAKRLPNFSGHTTTPEFPHGCAEIPETNFRKQGKNTRIVF